MNTSNNPLQIDIRKPSMIKLDDQQRELPEDAPDHHATKLPDFGLIFPNVEGVDVDHWKKVKKAGADYELYGQKCEAPHDAELSLIVDRTKNNPAADKKFFPKINPDRLYWTATKHPSSPSDYACGIYFGDGFVVWSFQHLSGLVLPVLRITPANAAKFGVKP